MNGSATDEQPRIVLRGEDPVHAVVHLGSEGGVLLHRVRIACAIAGTVLGR
ncbi:hypothetical protein ACFYZE_32670 [Streptomyces sp. NPDC001796]|uniref:hypothetical protein n=1 Tax=Streptomyces sp. NPDC001796 TaxID=3364609 RepID=UPI0036C9D6CF